MCTELGLFQEGCRLFIHVKPDGQFCVRKIISIAAVGLSQPLGLQAAPNSACQLLLLPHKLLPLHRLNIGAFQKQIFIKSIQNWTELILCGTGYGLIINFLNRPTV
jgi:hypothetical protein